MCSRCVIPSLSSPLALPVTPFLFLPSAVNITRPPMQLAWREKDRGDEEGREKDSREGRKEGRPDRKFQKDRLDCKMWETLRAPVFRSLSSFTTATSISRVKLTTGLGSRNYFLKQQSNNENEELSTLQHPECVKLCRSGLSPTASLSIQGFCFMARPWRHLEERTQTHTADFYDTQ